MAITDLIEKAKGSLTSADEYHDHGHDHGSLSVDIPDDLAVLDDLEPDPKPKRISTRQKGPRPTAKLTAGQRRQITDNLEMLSGLLCFGWSFRDDVCPEVLSDHQTKIIDKMVPLIARSPTVMEWLVGKEANFLDWVAFGHVMAPVAKVIWGHHVSHSIGHDHDDKDDHQHVSYDYSVPAL